MGSPKKQSPDEVVAFIRSGQRVFIHGAAATPTFLIEALVDQASRLRNVELIHLHTEGAVPYAEPRFAEHFRVVSLFVGANLRQSLDYDRVDYLPCFLSEVPRLLRSGRRKIDVALLHLSPPDENGFCSMGVSVDVARAAADAADVLLAQINRRMPRVHGDGLIHIDELDAYIFVDSPLPTPLSPPTAETEDAIGENVSRLIEDGACLQVGIGSIPNAVLRALRDRRHLGIHSEMWSDGVLDLIECGAVDNSRKSFEPGKTVSSFVMGSQRVYDFIDDNADVIQLGADIVNDPRTIAVNSGVVAINSAVEVDLTGQICADSIGHRILSGVGGQMDFMRGAALSHGGKPIIAMSSRTNAGVSRIVPELNVGAGVVTTRAHTHFVATEYGVADLSGCTLHERAMSLVEIAHPADRENLLRRWHETHRRRGS